MFEEILDTISAAFTIMIVIVVVCIVVGIIKGVQQSQEAAERMQREEEEKQKMINQIISGSKKFSTEVLISQREEVQRAFNVLYECKRSGSIQRLEIVYIPAGDDWACSMDLKTCHTVLQILDDEIKRRQG